MLLIAKELISFIFFLTVSGICLYLPGYLILKKTKVKTDEIENVSLSLSLGIALFVFLSLVLGYLKLRFFLFPCLLLLSFSTIKIFGLLPIRELNPLSWKIKNRRVFFTLLVLGILVQLWIDVFSGWQYPEGIKFWSSHGHDAMWHGSLMQEMRDTFPPRMKFLAGFKLQNYHYFVDVLMGEYFRLFKFNPLDLYFRFFPFLFASLFLLNGFIFVRNWCNEKAGYWAIFFTAFGGSFGYLVTLLQRHTLLGSEAIFWVSQGNTAIGNPPQICAFILFLTFLNLFYKWYKNKNDLLLLTLAALGGLIIGFKIYAGATILGGLFLAGLYEFLFLRKVNILKVFLVVLFPSLLVFLLSTSKGESFLVFQPWWYVRTMVVASDRLNWVDLELRRQFYLARHSIKGYLRVTQFELFALFIFFIGNLGTKILGVREAFRILCSRFKPAIFDIFLISCLAVCSIFPHIFVQKGVAWNTVQFFQYLILLMGFFAAISTEKIISKKHGIKKTLTIFLLIMFSIPTVIGNLQFFAPNNPLAMVENEELEALKTLNKITSKEDVIVTSLFNPYAAATHPKQPRPIYSWDSTGYVSYFADRFTYITDEGQVEILGYAEGRNRVANLKKYVFGEGKGMKEERDADDARQFLLENNLKYIYLVYGQNFLFDPQKAGLEKVFENKVAKIYKLK